MTKYLDSLFWDLVNGKSELFNKLIDNGIINYNEVLENLLNEGDSTKLYRFAKYINKVSREDKIKIANKIIERGTTAFIVYYAKDVEGAPVELLEDAIIKSDSLEYQYEFAKDVKGANIGRLEDAVISGGNAEYIFRFALNVPGANIIKLAQAITKTNDSKYICLFFINISNLDVSLFEDALVRIGNIDDYKKFLEYKEKLQDEYFNKLCSSINNDDMSDLEVNRERYAYLFKEPSDKAKVLIKKLSDRGY